MFVKMSVKSVMIDNIKLSKRQASILAIPDDMFRLILMYIIHVGRNSYEPFLRNRTRQMENTQDLIPWPSSRFFWGGGGTTAR